jgi:Secretion system C-terminal sorting domain
MKKILLPILLSLAFTSFGQLGVGVFFTGGPFVIKSGTVVSSDNLVLAPSADFNLTVFPNSLQRYATILHPAPEAYISRVYRWQSTTDVYSGDITINYLDAELNGLSESTLTLNIYEASSWKHYPSPATRDAINNYVTTTALSNKQMGELTLTSMAAPLPVHWAAVTAERIKEPDAVVKWSTYDEQQVKDYIVEKSADAQHWDRTGASQAAYNTFGNHHYEIQDEAGPEKVFYRIKEEDVSGSVNYSEVVSVNALNSSNSILVYPNPAVTQVMVDGRQATATIEAITVFNTAGASVRHLKTGPVHSYPVSLHNLVPGVYTIQVETSDHKITTVKLLKSNP